MARTIVESRPVYSATATPSMTARTTPSGGKETKFFTASVTIRERLSVVNRDSTAMVLPLPGSVAVMPIRLPIHDSATTTPERMTKSQNGLGSLLPTFSMTPRKPPPPVSFSSGSLVVVDP